MNKYKKEEKRKYEEIVQNMSKEDKENYDLLLEFQNKFNCLVNQLHVKLFPEEFDFYYDSNADAKDRGQGLNPMRKEYIDRVNSKREKLGFLPLSENGYTQDGDKTKEYCKKLIANKLKYKAII